MTTKSLENKCRRQLAKYGYSLRKGKTHPGDDESGYMIVESGTEMVVYGYDSCEGAYLLSLDDVVDWIAEKPFCVNR